MFAWRVVNVPGAIEAEAVVIRIVCSETVGGLGHGVVDHDFDLVRRIDVEQRLESWDCPGVLDHRVICEFQFWRLDDFLELRLVDFQVASDACEDEGSILPLVEDRLAGLRMVDAQESRQFVDCIAIRCMDFLELLWFFLVVGEFCGCDFTVGLV